MMNDAFNLISLFLTPTTIYVCFFTAVLFYRNAVSAFYEKHPRATQWIALGIAVSFLGSSIDNIYWGLAWSADFIGSKYRNWLFDHGVYSNVPFRQFCDGFGGYCHIRATIAYYKGKQDRGEVTNLHTKIACSLLVGLAFVLLLILTRWLNG